MKYLQFYGLKYEPFSNAPISKFYYSSENHQKVYEKLRYGVDNMKGLVVCTGGIGTGKTMMARRLLQTLPKDQFEAALLVIVNSDITSLWLLRRIAIQLGVKSPKKDKLELLSQLYRQLVKIHDQKKRAVVMIDEAQALRNKEIMEDFRGLLNMEMPGRKLITFVLFGLEEIDETLKIDEPLKQRMAVRCYLDPLNEEVTANYINHRMNLCGASEAVFPEDTASLIHAYTKGVPRLVNTVCDNLLFEGSLLEQKQITTDLVEKVAASLCLKTTEEVEEDKSSDVDETDDVIVIDDDLDAFDRLLNEIEDY